MDFFEKLIKRDLHYPAYMDWPIISDTNKISTQHLSDSTIFYQHPKNINRVVMVSNYTLNSNSKKQVQHKNVTYYYGSKIHRLDGPAQISTFAFEENGKKYKNCEIYWNNRGKKVRKNGPCSYIFRLDEFGNIKIDTLKWGTFLKSGKSRMSVLHKLNGPAHYTKTLYAFYIDGIAMKEYSYWKTMMNYYPQHMPKITYENDVKIMFEYNEKKPAPYIFYKNTNRIVYALKENRVLNIVDKEIYWKKMYEKLAIKNNWLKIE